MKLNNEITYLDLKKYAIKAQFQLSEFGLDKVGENIITLSDKKQNIETFVLIGHNRNSQAMYRCVYSSLPQDKTEMHIIVNVSGGIVQDVFHDIPNLNVQVIDQDIDGEADENLQSIQMKVAHKPKKVYVYKANVSNYQPKKVKQIYSQIK